VDVEGLILDVTPADGEFDRDFLEKLGHPVLVCHGPELGHLCPILKDGCEMVSSAHGVVYQLDLDRPQHRAILKRCREVVADDIPIVAVVREGQKARFGDLLTGVHIWESAPTPSELDGFAARVEAADWTRLG
jgi:hypothetical protein